MLCFFWAATCPPDLPRSMTAKLYIFILNLWWWLYIYIAAATPHYQNNININLKKKKVRRNVFFFKAILPLWQRRKCHTTFSNGCLGSHNDEERSEMRYVMRSANSRESSNLWTHIALPVTTGSMLIWVSANPTLPTTACWLGRRTLAFHDVYYIYCDLLKWRALRGGTCKNVKTFARVGT